MIRLRVLVAEDSLTIRRYLVDVLERSGAVEIVGEATNGQQAVEMCARLRPDVVTMDMVMPELNGVLATEQIMAYSPTPILIVSSSVNRGEAFRTYEALSAGAVDVLDKPDSAEPSAEWERQFLNAVRMVARIKVITHPRGRLRASMRADASAFVDSRGRSVLQPPLLQARQINMIAIGASTGGPSAIAEVLKPLPATYPIPIVVVLHISDLFAFAFSDWLAQQIALPVRIVRDGDLLPPYGMPGVLIAPAGAHTVVQGGKLRLTNTPERNSCRPSIDELFDSVARELGEHALMVLLTGMGKDGASGLLSGRKTGADTIAQNEDSSVVFGMPGEAIKMGAARQVLGLEAIGPYLKLLAER